MHFCCLMRCISTQQKCINKKIQLFNLPETWWFNLLNTPFFSWCWTHHSSQPIRPRQVVSELVRRWCDDHPPVRRCALRTLQEVRAPSGWVKRKGGDEIWTDHGLQTHHLDVVWCFFVSSYWVPTKMIPKQFSQMKNRWNLWVFRFGRPNLPPRRRIWAVGSNSGGFIEP